MLRAFDLEELSCDHVVVRRYCDRTLQLLLRTFFDIIRLRKGPEHLPDSVLVLLYALGLFGFAMFVSTALIEPITGSGTNTLPQSVAVSMMGYVLYWIVLAVTGYARRVIPTIASVMACGSILTVLMVAAFVMLNPFLGANFASIVAWLILMWSVPVKGHIIARAIGQHWYIGIAISGTIYIMQRVAFDTMTATTAG
jgi:hypothetical protein